MPPFPPPSVQVDAEIYWPDDEHVTDVHWPVGASVCTQVVPKSDDIHKLPPFTTAYTYCPVSDDEIAYQYLAGAELVLNETP